MCPGDEASVADVFLPSTGYPNSFRNLSIQMESRDSRPLPLQQQQQQQQYDPTTYGRSYHSNDLMNRQTPPGYSAGQPSTERLDPLSVLALAGGIVDREYSEADKSKKTYDGSP